MVSICYRLFYYMYLYLNAYKIYYHQLFNFRISTNNIKETKLGSPNESVKLTVFVYNGWVRQYNIPCSIITCGFSARMHKEQPSLFGCSLSRINSTLV